MKYWMESVKKKHSFHNFTASSHSFIFSSLGTSSVQAASRAVPKTPPVPVGEHGALETVKFPPARCPQLKKL